MKIIFSILLFLFSATFCQAATYYVRTDGGTSTQCKGTSNVAYSGSGTGQACAFNHPAWALGTNGNSGIMVSGDILLLDNINRSTGNQAQYLIGYGMPNTVSTNCNLYSPYECTLNSLPSNSVIAGVGYDTGCSQFNTRGLMAQLWGTESVKQVLNLSGGRSNVTVSCLELTDHSNCGFRVGTPKCAENYNGTSNGTYARNGIYIQGGSNIGLEWLDVHGFSNRNFLIGGQSGLSFSYVNTDGAYMSNWDTDVGETNGVSNFTGLVLLDHMKNRFSGCSEVYPRSSTFNTADYSNCTDQNDTPPGYGDGVGAYNTGGDWVIKDSEFSHNTQDGLDLLYHDGTGSVTIQRSIFEGNNGNQLKISALNINVENSAIVSNCTYLKDKGKVKNIASWTSCRAGGDSAVITVSKGGTYKFSNSSFYGNGNSLLLVVDRYGTCNGTEKYSFRNNIYVGNGNSSLYINQLGGACGAIPLDTDYSIIKNVSSNFCPSGSHNKCNVDPLWISGISQTADNNLLNINLQPISPAIGNADSTISLLNSNDVNNLSRGSLWDIGAIEKNSSTVCVSNGTCNATSPACGQISTGVDNCGNSCSKTGVACSTPTTCVPVWCDAPIPPCGQKLIGKDSCGNQCSKFGGECITCPAPIVCPAQTVCSAPTINSVSVNVSSNGQNYNLTK